MIRLRSEVTRIMVAIEASDDSPLFRFLDALAWLVSAVRWLVCGVVGVFDRLAGAVLAVETCLTNWRVRAYMTIFVFWMVAYEIGSQTLNTGRA